jgi:DNA-binding MarR family transcriptional regulator
MMTYTRMRTIDLVLADICSNPIGTLIEDAVRSIAARIGRSAGGITPALKRLAADGWITYLTDGRGTLIEVLKTDQTLDRQIEAEAPAAKAPIASASPESPIEDDHELERSCAASPCDQAPDRSACMEDHDSKTQEKEIARPLFDRLLAQPEMSRSLALKIAKHPIGTLADFLQDLTLAQSIAGIYSPFFFTVSRWRDGQRVVAPEEPRHEHPARSATAALGARRRSPKNRSEQAAISTPAPDYAALIAEWERTEPLGPIAMRVPGQRGAAYGDG